MGDDPPSRMLERVLGRVADVSDRRHGEQLAVQIDQDRVVEAVGFRDHLVEQAWALSLRQGQWKYISPNDGPKINKPTNTELGNDPQPQLYNLADDIGETTNLAQENAEKVKEMATQLERIRNQD